MSDPERGPSVANPEPDPRSTTPGSGSARGSSAEGSRSRPGDGSRRRRQKRKKRIRLRPVTLLKLRWAFATFVGAAVVLAATMMFLPGYQKTGTGAAVEFVVRPEESLGTLADRLAQANVVSNGSLFALWVRAVRGTRYLAPGPHMLEDDLSAEEVLRRLQRRGNTTRAHVTFPEGWTRFDFARQLAADHVAVERAFLDATTDPKLLAELSIDGSSAEGYLFPATYELPKDGDPRDLVRRLVQEFEKRFVAVSRARTASRAQLEKELGFQKREILILASMIEKEAAVDEERPVIASVFLNRLRDPQFKRKVLQSDPTSGYGCLVMGDRIPACAGYTGKITRAINVDPANPYSTYVHERLPPTPICNPGTKSIEAVLSAPRNRYLYFVAKGGGRHTFSETYEDHTAAVKGAP